MKYSLECDTLPRWITLNILTMCNYNCLYCTYHGPTPFVQQPKWRISLEQFKRQVNLVKEFDANIHVHICATGEPFAHPGIFSMFDYLNELGDRPSVLTNGSRIISSKLEKIADAGLEYLNTDLDTCNADEFKQITGVDDFDILCSNIRKLAELIRVRGVDTKLGCNTIITKKSLKRLLGLLPVIADLGFYDWNLFYLLFDYEDKGFLTRENSLIDEKERVYDVMNQLLEKSKEYALKLNICSYFNPQVVSKKQSCRFLWKRLMLNVPFKGMPKNEIYGSVTAGCYPVKEFYLGNMFSQSLKEIWNGSAMQKLREGILHDQNRRCNQCLVNLS